MQMLGIKNPALLGLLLLVLAEDTLAQAAAERIDESSVLAVMQQSARLASDVERDARSKPHKIRPRICIELGKIICAQILRPMASNILAAKQRCEIPRTIVRALCSMRICRAEPIALCWFLRSPEYGLSLYEF